MLHRSLFPIVLVVGLFAATGAAAQGMRCGVSLVAQGQWTYEVLEQCGEPVQAYVKTVYLGVNDGYAIQGYAATASIVVEQWVYDLGPHKLKRLLRFEDGQLMRIETLDRGILPP